MKRRLVVAAGTLGLLSGSVLSGCSKQVPVASGERPAGPGAPVQGQLDATTSGSLPVTRTIAARPGAGGQASSPGAGLPGAPQGASADGAGASRPSAAVEHDPYIARKWLSNVGMESTLAQRVRQELNLLAGYLPELADFARDARLDQRYLAGRFDDERIAASVANALVVRLGRPVLSEASIAARSTRVQQFAGSYGSTISSHGLFVGFMSQRKPVTAWRQQAIVGINKATSLDRMQYYLSRNFGDAVISLLSTSAAAEQRRSLLVSIAADTAYFRCAWAVRQMSDDEVYRLITQDLRDPNLREAFAATTGAVNGASSKLAMELKETLAADGPGVLRERAS